VTAAWWAKEGAWPACGEAADRFEDLLSLRNDLGLLAEEYDPRINRMVGNFPQALSHIPLVTAALLLSDAPRPPTGRA
jgi:GH15 family glucan-1,4-alpha-glucosidase